MKNIGGVDVFQSAEGLVDEGLEVGIGERLLGADLDVPMREGSHCNI